MSVEKLSTGIAQFAKDADALKEIIAKKMGVSTSDNN